MKYGKFSTWHYPPHKPFNRWSVKLLFFLLACFSVFFTNEARANITSRDLSVQYKNGATGIDVNNSRNMPGYDSCSVDEKNHILIFQAGRRSAAHIALGISENGHTYNPENLSWKYQYSTNSFDPRYRFGYSTFDNTHYNPYIDVWGARYGGPISGSNTKIQYYDSVQDTNSNGPVYFLCQYPANWHIVNFEYWADVITIHRSGNDRRSTVSYLLTVTTGFTVSYNYNGGSGSPSSVQNTTYVTLPSPSKSGYDFAGWYDEGGNYVGWSNGGYNVSRNVTLTAHWNLKTYWQNININDPNGTEGMGNVGTFSYYGSDGWHTNVTDQGSGTTVQRWTHIYVKDIKITAQGMHFKNVTAAGGSITQNGDTWDYTSPEGNGTININTAWNNYTVTYHTNGGTGSPDGAKDSWTYESSGNLRGKESLQRAYTITYKTNLASDTHSKNVTGVADGQTDTSTYSVIGWSTTAGDINNPDNVAKQYDFNQSVKNLTAENNANVDLYAVWRTQSKTLPTLVRQGYTFEGWYDSALGGNKIGDGGAAYIPRKDITLYAHWSPITYHAYYSLYGGSAKVRKDFTVEDTFTLNAPTVNQNYTFLGWIGDTDPQDHGAWGSGGAAITGPQKSPTVPAGTYGDVFFRAVYQPTVDALIQHKNAYYAKSSSQEMKY